MPKQVSREAADAARERAAKTGEPTARDRELAEQWYPLIQAGEVTRHDLALALTSVRFDAALVRKLERELDIERHGIRAAAARRTGVRKARS